MADLSITATAVLAAPNAVIENRLAAEALTAGRAVYVAAATGARGLADSNSGTAEVRAVFGIALHAASAGQPIAVLRAGDLTMNAVLAPGLPYFLSDTPGGICPFADLASGEFTTLIGIGLSSTVLRVNPQAAGVAI